MRIRPFVLSTFTLALGLASAPAVAAPKCEVKANASGTQTVAETRLSGGQRFPTTVQLNASPSQDATTYAWTQDPADAFQVTLSDAAAEKPTFAAPNVGPAGATLHFTLTATGCSPVQVGTDTTTVIVTNVNGPPLAAIAVTPSTTVAEGAPFTLDGSGSTDPDGDALTFRWERLDAGGSAVLVGTTPSVTINAPSVPYPAGASFTYRLTVSDGTLTNATTTAITVQWVNEPPVARATCTSPVNEGGEILLDALDQADPSSDPDDGIATYAWRQVSGGPDANLAAAALSYPAFSVDAPSLAAGHGDTMTFELKVTDLGGLFSVAQCTVVVRDVTKPVLSPANVTREATSAAGAVVTYGVIATDAFDGDVPVSCVPPSGGTFAVGDTPVSCSASDAAGNTATATFTVSVVDSTPPELTVPGDLTAEATGPSGAVVTFTTSAHDVVDGDVTPVCAPASGATFSLGTTTVTCTATDAHQNAASKTFDVIVQDTTAPALVLPQPIVAEATGASGAVVSFTATASDLVDGSVTPSCSPASGATFPIGATTVTCTATDAHQNAASGTFTVTVRDTTPPAVTVPADISAYATSAAGAAVSYPAATATDVVDGPVATTCTPASGAQFALGTTTVSCSATDAHDNTGTATFEVSVTYAWGAFLPPVSLDGRAAFKIGSTIPVRFALGGVSAGIKDAVAKLSVARVSAQAIGDELQPATSVVGDLGNQFRYDGTSYIFNWSTKGLPVGTWTLYVDLGDGEPRTITISTK